MKIDKKLLLPIILIMLVAVLEQFATDCYLPAFPNLVQSFSSTKTMIQLSLSLFLAGEALGQPIFGFISDFIGRRPMLILGIVIFTFSSIFCFLTKNIDVFLLARLIEGIGVGSGIVLARAMAKDLFTSDIEFAQFVSAVGSIIILIPLASPVIGGYVAQHQGWKYIFIYLTIAALFLSFALWFWLPETYIKKENLHFKVNKFFIPYLVLFRNSIFWKYLLLSSLAAAIAIIYITITPFFYQHILHLSPITFGWMTALVTIGAALGSALNAKLLARFGLNNMITSGIIIMLIAAIIMLILGIVDIVSLSAVLIPMIVIAVGIGFVAGNTASKALTPFPEIAGGASAIYGCLQFFIFAGVSAGASLVHTNNQIPLAILLLLPVVLIFVINKIRIVNEKE
jgi:MFS transporter, DHA1 family, 2-module integral membrane pump EmrD